MSKRENTVTQMARIENMNEQSLSPTTALVTGASRGIGAAIALQLAERGLRLILVARGQESLDQLAGSLPDTATVDSFTIDLSEPDGASRLLQLVNDREIDILINNAGGAPCLLYTSPSPRDRTRSRMPSSA